MYASTNTNINIVFCSYMNLNAAQRREKTDRTPRCPVSPSDAQKCPEKSRSENEDR